MSRVNKAIRPLHLPALRFVVRSGGSSLQELYRPRKHGRASALRQFKNVNILTIVEALGKEVDVAAIC